ncbi:MAG: TonB family protein [bacterium]|nr:TonB family protein [bacterium]
MTGATASVGGPRWIVPSLLIALVVNAVLFALMMQLTKQRSAPQDISDPVAVNLVTLAPPEPPRQEEAAPPVRPEPTPQLDFTPDLTPPPLDFGGVDLGPAVSVNLGGIAAAPVAEEVVFESFELDQPPQVEMRVPPVYPFKAREQGITGAVQVKLKINVDGSVGRVVILDARPKGLFEDAVRQCVPRWRFRPGMVAGEAVTSWAITTLNFELE